jgi:hypothetical protein
VSQREERREKRERERRRDRRRVRTYVRTRLRISRQFDPLIHAAQVTATYAAACSIPKARSMLKSTRLKSTRV